MKVQPASTVIHLEVKVVIKRFAFILIVAGGILPVSIIQSQERIQAEGKITYLTHDQVYSDIGSNMGVSVGDTFRVFRRAEEIGLIVVSHVARKSSVSRPLLAIDNFQLGDRVLLDKVVPISVEVKTEKLLGEKVLPEPVRKRWSFSHSGVLSIRHSYYQYSKESVTSRTIGTLQYGVRLTSHIQTSFWIYGRGNIEEKDFSLYQARLTLGKDQGPFMVQLGRVFSPELSGVGATDGVYISSSLSPTLAIGIMGGVQPDPASLKFDTDIKKAGGFIQLRRSVSEFSIANNLAVVGQYSGKEVDREFMYNKFTGDFKRILTLSMIQTLDIHRTQPRIERPRFDLISNQISIRIRPAKWIVMTSRYSARKQVIYHVSGPHIPDSLFSNETRNGWYNSLQFFLGQIGSIQTGANLRRQSGMKELSKSFFIAYQSKFFRRSIRYSFSTYYIKNLLVTGLKNRIGFSKIVKNMGTIYSEYEIYSFGYGELMNDYIQHNLSTHFNWQIKSKLYGSSSLEITKDKDYFIIFIYLGITLRF